jgi:hypothetical protein
MTKVNNFELMNRYKASWSKLLVGTSTFLTILFLAIGFILARRGDGVVSVLAWIPVLFSIGCALFTIRGYTITPDTILIRRLLWATELPRAGLASAHFVPNAMRWSIQTFGNGGFFSFSGFYWNKALGAYRAYVTDPARTVVMHYRASRTVLLSPAAPEDFVCDLGVPKGASES